MSYTDTHCLSLSSQINDINAHCYIFLWCILSSMTMICHNLYPVKLRSKLCPKLYSFFQIRTVMVAPGGEALGGVIGAFSHMIQTEGFFSLYKGLVPSLVAMAPSGAVFYGVYDILKSSYLHSPEGRKRIQHMKEETEELNAMEQLELGPIRTLIYGAIAGACSEAATYPFEVVRRQLQMQVRTRRLSTLSTCVKIVEQGGIPALYVGLVPSLLQVQHGSFAILDGNSRIFL